MAELRARERPESVQAAAELLRELGAHQRALRVRGGGTKAGWGRSAGPEAAVELLELETSGLCRILEHNTGDFTAVLEAGVPFADAQTAFAEAGQMLALDPPLAAPGAAEPAATVGGIFATRDSGPLRHRYGGPRDLVLGVTVALSDGTVAKAGGRVIKNVAGYDLGKLFTGSFGTLGLIATVAVRLHPRPAQRVTARAMSEDPGTLARAAGRLAALPLEADCLDIRWEGGDGELLVRFAGPTAPDQAGAVARRLGELGLADAQTEDDDEALWERQREAQRAADGAVAKVAGTMSGLAPLLMTARELGARTVARAGLGLAWVTLAAGADLDEALVTLRERLPEATVTVLDGAERVTEPWPEPDRGALAVMERIKARFDPARVFAPGTFVGGL